LPRYSPSCSISGESPLISEKNFCPPTWGASSLHLAFSFLVPTFFLFSLLQSPVFPASKTQFFSLLFSIWLCFFDPSHAFNGVSPPCDLSPEKSDSPVTKRQRNHFSSLESFLQVLILSPLHPFLPTKSRLPRYMDKLKVP